MLRILIKPHCIKNCKINIFIIKDREHTKSREKIVNLMKSKFIEPHADYYNYITRQGKMLPTEARVKNTVNILIPVNDTPLGSVGMTGYNRSFSGASSLLHCHYWVAI